MVGIEDGFGYVDDALVGVGIIAMLLGSLWGFALIAVGLGIMFVSGDFHGAGKNPFAQQREGGETGGN